ncbi:MAG TPA: PASTA domain-containing protein [Actinomycetes bacterium]|nr:PASTA domain-containing protein [Actinomycetes bacterium]
MARHTADLDALVGRTLGRRRYEVVARIAQGGMAIVYRGHDRQLDRVVAIKVPRPEFARDREFSDQFRREARTAARLSHPNVVAVYDSGEERGLPWIVMEHVSGRTLREVLDSQRRLSPESTAELLGPVADALDHAHHAGVVHLDVKPENLLLTSETVKVADFGLVRAAAQRGHGQALAATVHYCAPEVLRGGVVDGRADVYALAVVAWECVCGRAPFEGDARQVVAQHLGGRVPRPSQVVDGIPEPFDAAVARATDPDPTGRFLRASDFAAAIGAPRRRRMDETLRATTPVPPAGPDTATAWAPAAGAAAAAHSPSEAPTTSWPPAARETANGWVGQAQGAETRSLNALPAATAGATQAPPAAQAPAATQLPPAPQAPLRPRPTTGRVPKSRAVRPRGGRGRLLAALLVVGLLAAGLLTRAGGLLGGSVRVPEVVGLEVAEATRDLRDRGLRVRTGEPVASDHVHEGLVATQSIAGGERARRSDTVVIQPSLGIVLPDLAGRPADAAAGRLDELDIRFEAEHATSVDVPKGAVIQTRPDKGTVLKADDVVTVVVSAGKPKVEVPDVAGRRAEAAEAALADAHLKVRPERVFDDDVPEGRAVGTDPGSGSEVPWGSAVVLRVSKGPDLVEVPRVVGLSKKEAEQRLREAGLEAHYVFPVGSRVVEQSPGPGEKAKRGSGVRLLLNLF